MKFVYIGDPKRDGEGPDVTNIGGYVFEKNGPPVEIKLDGISDPDDRSRVSVLMSRLSSHSHFKVFVESVSYNSQELVLSHVDNETAAPNKGTRKVGRPRGRRNSKLQ